MDAVSTVTPEEVKTIGVVGAGQMGFGICQVAAQNAERNVIAFDTREENLERYNALMCKNLDKHVAKGKISEEEANATKSRITLTTSIEDLASSDFVIEAVSENLSLKQSLFSQLDELTKPEAILASNTSSISITKIAASTQRPDKVIGMHFMNPVPVMRLVEIITGLATSDQTLQTTLSLSHQMGKETAQSKDVPGFIANRILMPYINEAVEALKEGLSDPKDIDKCMKLGCGVPMGPLQLADFIGLDTCLSIMRVLHTELGDSKYRPSTLLVKTVDAGWLGVKSGRGFYEY
eukprot:TRINITY_DN1183_c1_g1_i12.p3 TRINITY_DN1183_c1_g1~~TRINITY_DN1183_c1_g1_i12.p3  ORF type:complete len:293 (-),score=96.22 TRINITY_DN1183_c1_g1_i12:1113-1991(-)